MLLNVSPDRFYDAAICLYEHLEQGEKALELRLDLLPGVNFGLLGVFLELVEQGQREFDAVINLEVVDHAGLLE